MKKLTGILIPFVLLAVTCKEQSKYKHPNVSFTLKEDQLPAYEKEIDHKGLIISSEQEKASLERGEKIYGSICFNCHGDQNQKGSIPTAFKFWSDSFKVGNDPYSIYQTVTRGYGSMPPQAILTPREKYDVINFIRQRFVSAYNENQYFKIDSDYVASLPTGISKGPEPKEYKPWAEMDYGNFLINTYELAGKNTLPRNMSKGAAPLADEDFSTSNFAYKGIAVRLDEGKGGIAAGKAWMIFDHDVMRVAGALTGQGFIDWQAILFNGKHNISPRTIGNLHLSNPSGPGWANPATGSFKDTRFKARDGRRFGPLPRSWAHYKGLYRFNNKEIISYTVGNSSVLETFGLEEYEHMPIFTRTLNITASSSTLKMRVAPLSNSVAIIGDDASLKKSDSLYIVEIPKGKAVKIKILISDAGNKLNEYAKQSAVPASLIDMTKGSPAQYQEILTTFITKGENQGPFEVDLLSPPFNSPWKNQLRLSGIDFMKDNNKAVICSTDGDVWLLTGLTENTGKLTWQRIASGLFQPLGIKVINEKIFVTCRDQIVRLNDLNGDHETDFYESFNSDQQVTDHFHEFAMGLQADKEGNLYYAKSARHAREALVPQHGTLIKVSSDGSKTEIIARGFRAANGVCINPDGSFIVTDQEGHWNPMNRINWVKKGRFYGNMFSYDPPKDSTDSGMEQPLVWVEKKNDQSPSELLWIDSKKWGPLNGSLINFSYGYGKIFIVPFEKNNQSIQGGIFELPVPRFSTGIMRGRFNPADGDLYVCGLSAWGSTQTLQLGGLYRVKFRDDGKTIIPTGLHATKNGISIQFTHAPDQKTALDTSNYKIETWDLLRSRRYGSDHYNTKSLKVTKAELSSDGKTLFLSIPAIKPTQVMEINYQLKDASGKEVNGLIQNTIHYLNDK